MTRLNLNPLHVLSIFVLVSGTLFYGCLADDSGLLEAFNFLNDIQSLTAGGYNKTNSWSQFPNANSSLTDNPTYPLAAERTRRIDPSNHFNYYEAGWNFTNEHYITSVAFTGTPLFVISTLWWLIVGIWCIVMLSCHICCCCRNKPKTDYSRKAYAISLIFLIIFLIMTIIGGTFLYIGQGKFQRTTSEVSVVLVSRANTVVDVIDTVVTNLVAAKNLGVGQYSLPDDVKQGIGKVEKVSNQTAHIKRQTEETAKISTKLLNDVSHSLIAVSAMMLALAVVGFLISICGWKWVVYFLFFLGWILVTGTLVLCGISFIVQNGVADTCDAMEDWLHHPRNHTALSKLLSCMDESAAKKTMDITRNTSFHMVNLVNSFVTNVANGDVPPFLPDIYYNQSGPLMPLLCNPFLPDLTERKCDPLEVELKSAPTAYQGFLCDVSPSGLCISMGRLTPTLYNQMMVATNMSDTLQRLGSFLASLVDCSFVIETFFNISEEDCPLLRRYSTQVFIGLMLVSVAVMFSVILWMVFVRERQFQISSKKLKRTHVEVQ